MNELTIGREIWGTKPHHPRGWISRSVNSFSHPISPAHMFDLELKIWAWWLIMSHWPSVQQRTVLASSYSVLPVSMLKPFDLGMLNFTQYPSNKGCHLHSRVGGNPGSYVISFRNRLFRLFCVVIGFSFGKIVSKMTCNVSSETLNLLLVLKSFGWLLGMDTHSSELHCIYFIIRTTPMNS